jgi:tetratricopeptide (TPR) repeat protein
VYKALAKDRNQRYQTLGDMLQDLINYCGVAGIRVDIEMAERTPVRAGGSEIGSDPKAAATGAGIGSTPPRSLTPAPAGSRTPVNITISDRHGGASGPRDPRARPPSTPSGTDDETTQVEGIQQAPARSPSIRRIAAGLGSVLILASIVWLFAHNRGRNMRSTDDARPAPVSTAPVTETPPAPAQEAKKDLPAANREPKTKQMLAKASEALRAHRYAEAASAATEVLKESPDDVEARSILQNSRNSLDLLRKGVRQARSYLAAGNYEKANSALAEALAIDPSDSEALQLGGQITQSARRAAEQAMVKAKDARSKADAVEAATFAARTWAAAQAADAESSRLLGQGRHADAAAKAAEAAGLYAGAEREARAESAANAERVRLAAMERQQSQLRTRSEASRQTYERVRDSAIQSGAQEKAKEQFAEAEQTAGNARAKLDGGNLDGAAKDYEAAASAMQQARNSAIEAVRKEGSRAISPPKPAPTAAVPQPAAEAHESAEAIQKAIYGVPEQYKAAMEGKNVDLLKSLWPALTPQQEQAYRNQWAYTRSLRMVANNSKIEQIQGDSAVLSVQFHNEQEINNGTRRKWDQKATFRLARKGRAWFIESLSFEELR